MCRPLSFVLAAALVACDAGQSGLGDPQGPADIPHDETVAPPAGTTAPVPTLPTEEPAEDDGTNGTVPPVEEPPVVDDTGAVVDPPPPVEEEEPPVVIAVEDNERPLVGGTLLVTRAGAIVAADPEGDRMMILDADQSWPAEVWLQAGAMPFRSVEDALADDVVYTSLRGTGQVAVIDALGGRVLDVWDACLEPRGIDVEPDGLSIWVACASGQLVELDTATGEKLTDLLLDNDLRDIVLEGDWMWISRMRSAQVLRVGKDGTIIERMVPPNWAFSSDTFAPTVAWRMSPDPDGQGVAMIHQRGRVNDINLFAVDDPYAGPGCKPIMHSAVTKFAHTGVIESSGAITDVPLPVDFHIDAGGVDVVSGAYDATTQITQFGWDVLTRSGECMTFGGTTSALSGSLAAIAYLPNGEMVTQSAETFAVARGATLVPVSEGVGRSPGYEAFHSAPTSDLACASCHPEGQEDGHVWSFTGIGPRRTQALAIDLRGTEPFHWDGDLADMHALVEEVFVTRMGGVALGQTGEDAILDFLEGIVPVRTITLASEADIEVGKDLFENPAVGCAECHYGPSLTNNETVDIGKGDAVQTASLIGVGGRGPFMHDGCAPTLLERFTDPVCGGGDSHGKTSILTPAQVDLVIAYLQTL